MKCLRPFALLGLCAVAALLFLDGCASKAGTSGGKTVTPAKPRVEEHVAAEGSRQCQTIQIFAQGAADVRQGEAYPLLGKLVVQVRQGAGCRVIDAGNGTGVDHQPVYLCWRIMDQGPCLFAEVVGAGIVKIGAEPEDDQPGFRLLSRCHGQHAPVVGRVAHHHGGVGRSRYAEEGKAARSNHNMTSPRRRGFPLTKLEVMLR